MKATIFFRGREMTRQSLGRQILERLIKDVENRGLVEFRPRQEGNTLHLILAPKRKKAARRKSRRQQRPRRRHRAAAPRRRSADSVTAASGFSISPQENLLVRSR